jgi:hypothetical protein
MHWRGYLSSLVLAAIPTLVCLLQLPSSLELAGLFYCFLRECVQHDYTSCLGRYGQKSSKALWYETRASNRAGWKRIEVLVVFIRDCACCWRFMLLLCESMSHLSFSITIIVCTCAHSRAGDGLSRTADRVCLPLLCTRYDRLSPSEQSRSSV